MRNEEIFWVPKSKFCNPLPPDEIIDNPSLDVPVKTLEKGENEWAYVLGLKATASPDLPVIASGFASSVSHTYTRDHGSRGGLWQGKVAIVVRLDTSGVILNIDQGDMTVHGPNGAGSMTGDIFTTANAANGWLSPENVVVNPK